MTEARRFEIIDALTVERTILANLGPTVGMDHPAYQSTVERIAALERAFKACD